MHAPPTPHDHGEQRQSTELKTAQGPPTIREDLSVSMRTFLRVRTSRRVSLRTGFACSSLRLLAACLCRVSGSLFFLCTCGLQWAERL